MPILDRMTGNNQPGGDEDGEDEIGFDYPRPQPVERKRPAPEFLDAQAGRGSISIAAVIERIWDEFRAEHTPDDSAVRAAKTRAARVKLLLPVVDYVLSVESVMVDNERKAALMQMAYSEIFGFGPLDPLLADPDITTITLEGAEKVSVRRGHGDLEPLDTIFEDTSHMKEIVGRLLTRADAALLDNMPLVEVGLEAENGRFLSMSLAAPPITIQLTLDIRLHPVKAPTLNDLLEKGMLTADVADVLRGLLRSEYGFAVVGQPESGKTMMLSALLGELETVDGVVSVERTGELFLPDGADRKVAQWPVSPADDGVTFGEQIEAVTGKGYRLLILDEVRADEPHTIAPLLRADEADVPRMIWSVRGTPDSKRLRSALGMLARRADESQGEKSVRSLFERVPFVVSVRRLNGEIQLREIGEWYIESEAAGVSYRSLVQNQGGVLEFTGESPDKALPGLSAGFWEGRQQ